MYIFKDYTGQSKVHNIWIYVNIQRYRIVSINITYGHVIMYVLYTCIHIIHITLSLHRDYKLCNKDFVLY